jgi:hypothetical protein
LKSAIVQVVKQVAVELRNTPARLSFLKPRRNASWASAAQIS